MTERELFYGTSGPPDAKIVIVGESWGREEAAAQRPFVGPSGQELNRLLSETGINRYEVLCTNIVAEQPHANETFRFFRPKNSHPNAQRVGGLIPSELVESEMRRLYQQLAYRPRSLVIGAGNWALWGLCQKSGSSIQREANGRRIPEDLQTYGPTGIVNWRGSMIYVEPHKNFLPQNPESHSELSRTPFLPIIHPAAIMREWALRAPTLHDLRTRAPKALRNDWRSKKPHRTFSPPTFDEAVDLLRVWLASASTHKIDLACDIETFRRQFISCIGFSDGLLTISIPFISGVESDGSVCSFYRPEEEARLVGLIRRVFLHPQIRIIGQNFIYDTQFIQHWLGATPRLYHDTMLCQNVLFPGTPKDLSYLSSLYCDYHWYWKDDVKDWSRFGNLDQLLDYNCIDVARTFEIAQKQLALVRGLGQEDQMRFKMRTNQLCLRMMNRGVLIDTARRGSMLFELQVAETAFQQELLSIIPQAMVKPHSGKKTDKFWFRSAKQTAELLYDILGMSVVNHRKTGNRTVGKEALAVLERKHPEFTGLFRRLDYLGSVSNTVGVIQTPTEHDGRMRCSYNPGGTETHRLSSSENVFGRGTNLQNLTKGEED